MNIRKFIDIFYKYVYTTHDTELNKKNFIFNCAEDYRSNCTNCVKIKMYNKFKDAAHELSNETGIIENIKSREIDNYILDKKYIFSEHYNSIGYDRWTDDNDLNLNSPFEILWRSIQQSDNPLFLLILDCVSYGNVLDDIIVLKVTDPIIFAMTYFIMSKTDERGYLDNYSGYLACNESDPSPLIKIIDEDYEMKKFIEKVHQLSSEIFGDGIYDYPNFENIISRLRTKIIFYGKTSAKLKRNDFINVVENYWNYMEEEHFEKLDFTMDQDCMLLMTKHGNIFENYFETWFLQNAPNDEFIEAVNYAAEKKIGIFCLCDDDKMVEETHNDIIKLINSRIIPLQRKTNKQ